jgi:hypothetical protein
MFVTRKGTNVNQPPSENTSRGWRYGLDDLPPAAELVGTIATEAEHALREVTRFID